jgi:hypothetical protein
VVIDPPDQMRALVRFATKALADVYMRNLQANRPDVYVYSYVLKPGWRMRNAASAEIHSDVPDVDPRAEESLPEYPEGDDRAD